jgi:carbonic anhydrase
MAMFPVSAGFLAHNLMVYGDVKVSSLILVAFTLQNLFLCYFWRRLQSEAVKSFTLFGNVAFQWGYVATCVVSTYLNWTQGIMTANLIGIFAVSGALVLYMVRMSIERSGSAAAFSAMGLAVMAAMVWRGLGDWTMSVRALSGVPGARGASAGEVSKGVHGTRVSSAVSGHTGISGDVHWEYKGEMGPDMWGALREEFRTCASGLSQSPVDIPKRTNRMKNDIRLEWVSEKGSVVNNGHSIQVNLTGKSHATIAGQVYTLRQFHFHTPSEHQVGGLSYPMEVHFVHSTAEGKLAVIGALVEVGAANQEFGKIMPFMPANTESAPTTTSELNLATILPKDLGVFRYQGSLTTPPCSEGVLWSVLAEPVEFSQDQVTAFRRLFSMNARPVQPMGSRSFEATPVMVGH